MNNIEADKYTMCVDTQGTLHPHGHLWMMRGSADAGECAYCGIKVGHMTGYTVIQEEE